MHKTFKNQKRYKLDKTPIKSRKHTQVWQEKELSKLYQNPNQPMIEGTTLKRCQMKVRYQLMKISSRNKPNPLHFSWWHKVPRRKMFVFQRDVIGIKYQTKTTNVQKAYRIAPPRCVHYLWSCIWIQNAHKWDHHSPYKHIIQTLVKFKKGKKLQYQLKERCSTQSRIASPRIVHYQEVWLLNVNAQ